MISPDFLRDIGHVVCEPCRLLHRAGSTCPNCAGRARTIRHPIPLSSSIEPELPGVPLAPPPVGRHPLSRGPLTSSSIFGPEPTFSPSLDEVLASPVPTCRHVPSGARLLVAEILSAILTRLAERPAWEDLYRLMTLPKLLLAIPARAGARHPKQSLHEIQRRAELFLDGRFADIWKSPAPSLSGRVTRGTVDAARDDTLSDSQQRTIRALVEEGAFSKAAKVLVSRELCDSEDPDIRQRLMDLHPSGSRLSLEPLPYSPVELSENEWVQLIYGAIGSFAAGSAPGPSGLRPCHLKDCIRRPGSASLLGPALVVFTRKLLSGTFPPAAQRYLCASTLIPLNKKDGGVRPIAVGDTLRRLVGKVLLRIDVTKEQVATLGPRQCGVGVMSATELVGMGVQRTVQALGTAPWVALQVDVANAFNTIDRRAMVRQAITKVPAAAPWLQWCYAQEVPLYCQGKLLCLSRTGVHQGDALGPLGFALGLDEALDACATEIRALQWCTWYLDDGIAIGTAAEICRFWDTLVPALARVGLLINPRKCQLWGPGLELATNGLARLPAHAMPSAAMSDVPALPFVPGTGISVLGTPIHVAGDEAFANATWEKTVDSGISMLERLRLVADGQTRHGLVRHCLDACKVMHLLRATPLTSGAQPLSRFSAALQLTVTDLVGCPLTAISWAQATLPISQQGLGIQDPTTERPAARMAALVRFHRLATSMVGIPERVRQVIASDSIAVMRALQDVLGPAFDPLDRFLADPATLRLADETYARQDWWAAQVATIRRDRLPWLGSARDHIRLASSQGPVAGEWLGVHPSASLGTALADGEFRLLCRWWLGLPLLPEGGTPTACPLCHNAVDVFGDHFVTCQRNGLTARHNAVRDTWSVILTQAGISHSKEVSTLRRDRPADILLRAWDKGRHVAVDFVITHPVASSSSVHTAEGARRHLRGAESAKIQGEESSCAAMGWGLHPVAYSPWGGQGPAAASLLREVLRRLSSDREGWTGSSASREARQSLSLALARSVASQLALRARSLESSSSALHPSDVADVSPLLTLFPWWE